MKSGLALSSIGEKVPLLGVSSDVKSLPDLPCWVHSPKIWKQPLAPLLPSYLRPIHPSTIITHLYPQENHPHKVKEFSKTREEIFIFAFDTPQSPRIAFDMKALLSPLTVQNPPPAAASQAPH
jgi:hypothetical protein